MSYNKVCTKREVGLHVSIGGVATPETPPLDPGLHSTPLEIGIFFAEVNFWPKTIDYGQVFLAKWSSFFVVLLLLTGRCHEVEIGIIALLMR